MANVAVHISSPTVPPAVENDDALAGCCMGAAARGVRHCTCWEPVFDFDQAEPDLSTEPTTREKCCHDCAYRIGSPERERGEEDRLTDVADDPLGAFWCHQGVRRVVAYRHPDGREFPAGPGDYQPPIKVNASGTRCIFKADGTAGERCAGWAAVGDRRET